MTTGTNHRRRIPATYPPPSVHTTVPRARARPGHPATRRFRPLPLDLVELEAGPGSQRPSRSMAFLEARARGRDNGPGANTCSTCPHPAWQVDAQRIAVVCCHVKNGGRFGRCCSAQERRTSPDRRARSRPQPGWVQFARASCRGAGISSDQLSKLMSEAFLIAREQASILAAAIRSRRGKTGS